MDYKKQKYTLILWGVGLLIFVLNLGAMGVDIMETRNFITVRELLESGDWLQPTMNGELRLAKPPLPTWITAVFASIFGMKSLFFLRLPAALMSVWLLFSLNTLVKRLTKNPLLAMLTAVSVGGMLYVFLLGRRGTWDIYTHSFMLAAIVQFVALLQSEKPLWRGVWGGLLLGLSFLSKGPVALYAVFFPFLIAYLVVYRKAVVKSQIIALVVFAFVGILVGSSWFLYINFVWQDETSQVLGKEIQNWHSYNVRPWYYYVKDYPVHSGLWAAVLAMGLLTKYTWNKSTEKSAFKFFWLWTALSVILLSLIPEKKIRYLLPTFLPATFLVGSYFYYLIKNYDTTAKKIDQIIFKIHWGIFVLGNLAVPLAVYFVFYRKEVVGLSTLLVVSVSVLLLYWFLFQSLHKNKRHFLLFNLLGLLVVAILFVIPHTDRMANKDFHSVAEIQSMKECEDVPCYATEETRIELVWFAGRKIKQVESLDDLKPPYLLFTNKPPQEYMQGKNIQLIGFYDHNKKPKGHKYHRQSLKKYVSLVRD